MMSWALSALTLGPMRASRWQTRKMWVSMAMAGIPKEKLRMMPADLGPMPLSWRSQALASARGISARKVRSRESWFRSRIWVRTSLMRGP